MVKSVALKITKIILILAGVGLIIFLLVENYYTYISTSQRFLQIFDLTNLKNFFENYLENNAVIYEEVVGEISDSVNNALEKINNIKPIEEILIDLIMNTVIFILNLLNYFCNIGINIIMLLMIYYNETFNASNLKIKYTKGAYIFLKIHKLLHFITKKIKDFLKLIFKTLSKHRRKVALTVLLIFLGNGLLYQILTEVLIFFITYIYHAIRLETFIILSTIGQALFLMLFPKLKMISYPFLIIILLYIVLIKAFQKANLRLRKNHERLKKFAIENLTQTTFINGAPGIGKTLLNVALTLISEEVFIDILQNLLIEHELKYPEVNFAKIRNNAVEYPEHQEYIKIYETLNNRGSFIISNYAIYSPYFKEFSKIFDFDYLRKNIKAEIYPLEEYIIISLSELDKEYNSHDDMKQVGEDGVATFFSTTSHDLKRHVKIFCDYQLKDQVPLRIRGNSEYFLTVKKRKKKYPFLLYMYYFPFLTLAKITRKLITRYETKRKTITKKTKRKQVPEYKRNDYNFAYALLRNLGFTLNKICDFFDRYWYFKLSCQLSQEEGGKGETININLNICDLSIEDLALYDSTFLSYAYEEKKNKAFKELQRFTSLRPTTEELTLCHSRFYDKLNGLYEPPEKGKKTKTNPEDEYIEV